MYVLYTYNIKIVNVLSGATPSTQWFVSVQSSLRGGTSVMNGQTSAAPDIIENFVRGVGRSPIARRLCY